MILKKIPAREEAQPGHQKTFTNFDYSHCNYERRARNRETP